MTIFVIDTQTHIYTTAYKTIIFKTVIENKGYLSALKEAKAVAFDKACESAKSQCDYIELLTAENDTDILNYLNKHL